MSEVPLPLRELQRHRDRRIPKQGAFEGPGDGAGIRHIVTHIQAAVDARDDEVGRTVEDFVDADVDAVGWRAVDAIDTLADLLEPERPAQGERVPDRARFVLGRDDRDLAEPGQRRGQRFDAGREIPVVIGDKNSSHVDRNSTAVCAWMFFGESDCRAGAASIIAPEVSAIRLPPASATRWPT